MYTLILHEEKGARLDLWWTGEGWSWNSDRAHLYEWDAAVRQREWLVGIAGRNIVISEE